MALVSYEDVGRLLLAEPLKADELPKLTRLLRGVNSNLSDLQRKHHNRVGDHLSSDQVINTSFMYCINQPRTPTRRALQHHQHVMFVG